MSDTDLKMIELDPAIWFRGRGGNGSVLFNPENGMRCCLGIAAQAFGVADDRLSNQKVLGRVEDLPRALAELREGERDDLYYANDFHKYDDKTRVEALNTVLIEADAPFRFVLKAQAA